MGQPTVVQIQTDLDRKLEHLSICLAPLLGRFENTPTMGFSRPITFAYGALLALAGLASKQGKNPNATTEDLLLTAREIVTMDECFKQLETWKLACTESSPLSRSLQAGWTELVRLATEACEADDESKRQKRS